MSLIFLDISENILHTDNDITAVRYMKIYNRLFLVINILLIIKKYTYMAFFLYFDYRGALDIEDLKCLYIFYSIAVIGNSIVIYASIHQMLDFCGFELMMLIFDSLLTFSVRDIAQAI